MGHSGQQPWQEEKDWKSPLELKQSTGSSGKWDKGNAAFVRSCRFWGLDGLLEPGAQGTPRTREEDLSKSAGHISPLFLLHQDSLLVALKVEDTS